MEINSTHRTPVHTLTCDHCDFEIDVNADPRCVVYDPSGATDVICEACRKFIFERWQESALGSDLAPSNAKIRIKRGWQA